MTPHVSRTCRSLAFGLILWMAGTGTVEAFQMFPANEIQEAHALRQRVLVEVPQLDPKQLRHGHGLSPEELAEAEKGLASLQTWESENPFFYWAQGELLRQTRGPAAGAAAFDRARQTAGQRVLVHWLLWQEYLAGDLRSEAEQEERVLQSIQLSWGLTRFPLLAAEEVRLGGEAADTGDLARALVLYDSALVNTPESPEALFGRASLVWQTDKTRFFEALRNLVTGLSQSLRGREIGFRVASNMLLSLMITWLVVISLVALVLAIRLQPLFGHELSEGLLKSLPSPSREGLSFLLFLLPMAAGLGLCWGAIVVFLVCGPYMTGRERGVVSLLLAVLVVLPVGYEWVAVRHVLASSRQFALVRAVERGGRGEALVQEIRGWADEAPREGLPHYYLGLVLKRQGELAQAEGEMSKASQLIPEAGFVQVGLGNVQYLLGRLPEAEATYRRAADVLPASASVQLNLSKLYAQRLQLDQSNEAVSRSLSLDPLMARTVSPFHGLGITEFVIDEPVPWDTLVRMLAPGRAGMHAVAEDLWASPLRGVPLSLVPYVVGGSLILFWAHVILRGGAPPARRCQQCGTPFCGRCQTRPRETVYCSPCAAVFRWRDGVTAFVRGRRIREGEEWLRRERTRMGILGTIIPGGSDLYKGRFLPGLLLCVLAVWLFAEGIVLDLLMPSFRFASPLPGPIRYPAIIASLVALYLYSLHRSWRRPSSGTQ